MFALNRSLILSRLRIFFKRDDIATMFALNRSLILSRLRIFFKRTSATFFQSMTFCVGMFGYPPIHANPSIKSGHRILNIP